MLMRRMLTAVAATLALHTAAVAAPEADSNQDPATIVETSLIADTTAVEAGKKFTIGVLYKISPGWHIYWKNPGASGFATSIAWRLGEGMPKGDTQYPTPIVFESPGPVVSYGYEGEVLLMLESQAPADLSGTEIQVSADTRWLMCSDRCIPNKKSLTLKLPVGKAQPANQQVFAKYKAMLPKKITTFPPGVKISGDGAAGSRTYRMTVAAPEGKLLAGETKLPDVRRVFFFPDIKKGLIIDTPNVTEPAASAGALKAYKEPAVIVYKVQGTGSIAAETAFVRGVLAGTVLNPDGTTAETMMYELDIEL